MLYELLTGRPPFDPQKLVQNGLEEMRRTLREREPQRPSTMVTTLQGEELTAVARQHGAEPPKLISILKGDLDWIVMKALEKDRRRRYETANGLAMDIERYLHNEPVIARPPSRFYRFQKSVRRNKVVFGAGAAVLLALLAGTGTSTWLFLREREARRQAVAAGQREITLRRQAEFREKTTQLTLLVSQEKFEEANALLGQVAFTQPTMEGAAVLRSLGEWQVRRGNIKAAAECFSQLLQVDQFDGWDVDTLDYLECGPVLLELGDRPGYESFRRSAIARFSGTAYPVADRIIKVSLLLPADEKMLASMEPLAAITLQTFTAADSGPQADAFRASWQCLSLALMAYRTGHYTQAAGWCRKCLNYPEYNAPRPVTAQLILAMACWRLQATVEAQADLAMARKAIEAKFSAALDHGSAPNGFWFDWTFARVLLPEAAGLIGGGTPR